MDSKKFGEFIATIRKEKGWTQAESTDLSFLPNNIFN
mgnify:CR=1 FL=1